MPLHPMTVPQLRLWEALTQFRSYAASSLITRSSKAKRTMLHFINKKNIKGKCAYKSALNSFEVDVQLDLASVASIERLTSVATDMMTKKRNRLSALRAEKMMLLRAWIVDAFRL